MTVTQFLNQEDYKKQQNKFMESIREGLLYIKNIAEQEREQENEIEDSLIELFYLPSPKLIYDFETLNIISDGYTVMQLNENKNTITISKEHYTSLKNISIYAEDNQEYFIQHFINKYLNLNRWEIKIETIK